jgi:predicted acyltransferase
MLSTMNPIANVLLGILAGEWLRSSHAPRRKVVGLAVAGIALMLAGEALNPLIPINKKIWTDSFMLFSGGFSLLAMALLYWLIDLRGWRLGTKPALIFGSNAILGFALANMLNPLEPLLHFNNPAGHAKTIQVAIVQLLARFMNAYNASFGYALFFVAVNLGFLWIFYRKKIFLRL